MHKRVRFCNLLRQCSVAHGTLEAGRQQRQNPAAERAPGPQEVKSCTHITVDWTGCPRAGHGCSRDSLGREDEAVLSVFAEAEEIEALNNSESAEAALLAGLMETVSLFAPLPPPDQGSLSKLLVWRVPVWCVSCKCDAALEHVTAWQHTCEIIGLMALASLRMWRAP
jgi:hypothetical protein